MSQKYGKDKLKCVRTIQYCYCFIENGIKLYGMDGKDAGVGASRVGGTARSRRRAALQRLPHARTRYYFPNDRPKLTGMQYIMLLIG